MRNGYKVNQNIISTIKYELHKFPDIPKDLCDYIINAAKKNEKEKLIPAISNKKNRAIVLSRLNNQFKKASYITKVPPSILLKALDFHSKDTSLGRIDAVFAELRTILFLNNMKFKNIEPLKANKNEQCTDFIAQKNSHKFSIEVYCRCSKELKNNQNEIIIDPNNAADELFQQYISIAQEKKSQFENTDKKYLCNKNLMVMVLNDPNIWGILEYHEYYEIIKKIAVELNWGNKYYFAIVTGVTDLMNNQIDDILYPSLNK
jgi:hypothetical protein